MPSRRLIAILALTLTLHPAGGTSAVPPAGEDRPAESGAPHSPGTTGYPRWLWPGDHPQKVLRPFGAPATRFGAGHRGIDLAGHSVLAPADGVVHFAGDVFGRGVLSIRHTDGLLSSFEPVSTALQPGDRVSRGQVVAQLAPPSGHCEAGCLHFGVRLDGEYLSPMNFFGDIPRSVLLPTQRG